MNLPDGTLRDIYKAAAGTERSGVTHVVPCGPKGSAANTPLEGRTTRERGHRPQGDQEYWALQSDLVAPESMLPRSGSESSLKRNSYSGFVGIQNLA